MKDNLNIEELFKEKFNAFEAEVNPSAWANIQQGINVSGAAGGASAGMSVLMKTIIISGGIVAATFGGIYLFTDNSESNSEISVNELVVPVDEPTVVTPENTYVEPVTPANSDEEGEVFSENHTNDPLDESGLNEGNTVSGQSNVNAEGPSEESAGGSTGEAVVGPDVSDRTTNNQNTGADGNSNSGSGVTNAGNEVSGSGTNNERNQHKPTGNISFEPGDDYAPSTYHFHANASDFDRVIWEFEKGVFVEGTDVDYTFKKPGKYAVKMVVEAENKSFTQSTEVEIKSKSSIDLVPNIISPNGDRRNDFFVIRMTDIETFVITISNKNGEIVFQSADPDFKWYGTDQGGNLVEKGEYYYEFFAKGFDGTEFPKVGAITVE